MQRQRTLSGLLSRSGNRNKRNRTTQRPIRSRSLKIEALQKRELLAAGVWLSGSDIRIEGDYADDRVEVAQIGSEVKVTQTFQSGAQRTNRFAAADVDRIFFDGGEGNDTFVNRTSIKSLAYGRDGADKLVGGTGSHDQLIGGDGNDTLIDYGGGTARTENQLRYYDRNYLLGGAGNDTLIVYSGSNYMDGGSGNDAMYGGVGADLMVGGVGNDFLYGNAGNDFLYGLNMDWAPSWEGEISQNEYFCYGSDRDVLIGGYGADKLEGGPGDDHLDGGNFGMPDHARDTLEGGTGHDTFVAYYFNTPYGLMPYREDVWEDLNQRYFYRSGSRRTYDSDWRDSVVIGAVL